MTAIPQALVLDSVRIKGATERVIVRPQDETIRTLKAPWVLIDPADPTYNANIKTGSNLFDTDAKWLFTLAGQAIAANANWGGRDVFSFTNNFHDMHDRDDQAIPSYALYIMAAAPQSIIDLMNAGTLGQRYLLLGYNPPLNQLRQSLLIFGSPGSKGFTFVPLAGVSGNGFNLLIPATIPALVADEPFIFGVEFDAASLKGTFYFNDPDTPVAEHVFLQAAPNEVDAEYWPFSFGPGSNTVCWEGAGGPMLVTDYSNPSTRITPTQRRGIFNDWKAHYAM